MARLFVAVKLSESVTRKVAELAQSLTAMPDVRWVRAENLHITVRFLGETDSTRVPLVIEAMQQAASRLPLQLRANGLGTFPNARKARVLWVGIEDVGGKLGAIAAALEDWLSKSGFEREERAFVPHLTLARMKAPQSMEKVIAERGGHDFGMSEVTELTLYESKTLPSGPRYSPLHVIRAR